MEKKSPLDFARDILEFHEDQNFDYDHASQKSNSWGGPINPLEFTPGRTRTFNSKGQPSDSDND